MLRSYATLSSSYVNFCVFIQCRCCLTSSEGRICKVHYEQKKVEKVNFEEVDNLKVFNRSVAEAKRNVVILVRNGSQICMYDY
jgi:hypothetical protein